jgi:hypothetical protein
MRTVFGFAAAAVLLGAYVVCPQSVRASFAETVTPDQQTLEEMQDGVDTLFAFFGGPEEIKPETPPL